MNIKIIRSENEYRSALARIEELFDIPEGDPRENELELLYLLVEKYESENYKIELPDPIEAIKFRMEQSGLERKDLVKYIGSMSKVSEILNRKRPLSLSMIRALHEGLGIPAEILLQKSDPKLKEGEYNIADYPFSEMFRRGYFSVDYRSLNEAKEYAGECLEQFFSNFNKMNFEICFRKSKTVSAETAALKAWQARVVNIINEEKLISYNHENLKTAVERIVKLSYFPSGIQLVKEALNKIGIHFVTLSHLPKTRLDGTCFFSGKGNPVIAMTLRYDRLDYFWFTLLHELGHISNGDIHNKEKIIFDDIEADSNDDEKEISANQFALDSFIPLEIWNERKNSLTTKADILNFAEELGISPAVIAGRIRMEESDFTKFTDLAGQGKVRELLKEFM